MLDFIIEKIFLPCLAIFSIFVFVMFGIWMYFVATGQTREQILYQQCISDGIKEYECYGMIYGRHGK